MQDFEPTETFSSPQARREHHLLKQARLEQGLLRGGLLGDPLHPPSKATAQYYLHQAKAQGFDPRQVWDHAVELLQQGFHRDPPWTWEAVAPSSPNRPASPAPTSPTE